MKTLITATGVALLATAALAQSPGTELRYRVYYQCNGERLLVDHCRKDDDGKGYGPPTKPQENYCLVYYPDRPRRSNIMVQSAELYDDIVKKLQACGALAGSSPSTSQSATHDARDYYAEGKQRFNVQDYAGALPLLEQSVRQNPKNAGAWSLLGTCYFSQKRYPEALAAYQQLVRLDSNDPVAWYLLGVGYLKTGNREAAIEIYHQLQKTDQQQAQRLYAALNQSPAPQPAAPASTAEMTQTQSVRAYYDAKDYDRAIEAAKKILGANPNNAEVLNLLGLSYSATKRYPEAAAALQQAVKLQPKEAQYPYNLGDVYFFAGDYAKAIPAYQSALSINPAAKFVADAYHWIGQSYDNLKQFDPAIKALRRSLELKPEDPVTLYHLGLAYFDAKQYPQAEEAFAHALRIKPDQFLCNYFIGYIYNEQEQPAKAVPYFQAELRLNPKHVLSRRELGFSYIQMGKYADAVSELQLVLQADPKNAIALYLLGEAYVEMGNMSGAKQVLQTLQPLDKDSAEDLKELIDVKAFLKSKPAAPVTASKPASPAPPSAGSVPQARQYIVMGSMTSASGDPAKALEYYQKAAAVSPDNETLAMAYSYEGTAYDSLKQFDKAVAAYRECLKLNPKDQHTTYLLGWDYAEMGKKDEAMKIYQALLPADKAEADHLYLKIQAMK